MTEKNSPPTSLTEIHKNAEWIFVPGAMRELLGVLGFLPELIDYLEDRANGIGATSSERAHYVAAGTHWLTGAQPGPVGIAEILQALIAVAGLPQMLRQHAASNIPFDVTCATALDLQRRMLEIREKTGHWGFDRLHWHFQHVHRGLLEIGRLQYLRGPWGTPFRVLGRKNDRRRIQVFPEGGQWCSEAGWLEKGADAFETVFTETETAVIGNPVDSKTGRIQRLTISLAAAEFGVRLSRETPVLHVHIPSGAALDRQTCTASLQRAADLFKGCFPEMNWKAFCCTSWLLDRELAKCLPENSNIVAFGRLFFPLATPKATSTQLFERVFDGDTDWKSFQPRSRLQAAILRHLGTGGTFRNTSGFLLRASDDRYNGSSKKDS